MAGLPYLWQDDIERIADSLVSRYRYKRLGKTCLMFVIEGIERNVAEISVCDFGNARTHKVVEVKGNCAIRNSFVPAEMLGDKGVNDKYTDT